MVAEFFTADTHLGHRNIIRYTNRPFATLEEMDEVIISNINSRVRSNDILYHLGDVAFGDRNKVVSYLERINCKRIHLILGNHDKVIRKNLTFFEKYFESIHDFKEIKTLCGQEITLCHYALRTWRKSHYGAWSLFGHSHGSLPDNPNALSWDVGVDNNNFVPLSMEDLKIIMGKKTWKPIDHHGAEQC